MIVSFDLDYSIWSSVTQDILLHSEFFFVAIPHCTWGALLFLSLCIFPESRFMLAQQPWQENAFLNFG